MKKMFEARRLFITTPIFYINSKPHLGHLYTLCIADYLKRAKHQSNLYEKVYLLTGTDEHGKKVMEKAIESNEEINSYAENSSKLFRDLADNFYIDYDFFIRTTDLHHKEFVQDSWKQLQEQNYIYSDTYNGWYSIRDESFIPEKDLVKNEKNEYVTKEGSSVEYTSEQNYLFRLSNFNKEVLKFLNDEDSIIPKEKASIINSEYTEVQDISISRDKKRVSWAINVPNDPTQTIYVWFDALLNYLSGTLVLFPDANTNKFRSFDYYHIVGKDIIRFHTVIWKGLLSALGIESKVQVLVHDHW